MMEHDKAFFDKIYSLKLINRLKFFLLIWNNGKFEDELEKELEISQTESLQKYSKMIETLGFLSIGKKLNSNSTKKENFYFISDENFKNIFIHICDKVKVKFNQEAYELAFNERINIYPIIEEKINAKLDSNELLLKEVLTALLNKNIAFFFIFIMRTSQKIKNNEFFDQLTIRLSEHPSVDQEQFFKELYKYTGIPSFFVY